MGLYDASRAATFREMQRVIHKRQAARRAPIVVWQGLQERIEAFDTRIAALRSQLPNNAKLLAPCEPHPHRIDGVTLCELTRPVFEAQHPAVAARYRTCYGSRARGGSWGFGRCAITRALERPTRFLCAREFQNSIAESVHKALADQIDMLGLGQWFDVQNQAITCANGSEFFFMGVRSNPGRIKSTEGADVCWLEEAESISDESWQIIVPTIRKAGSEIWTTFNPRSVKDPTYERLVANPPPNCRGGKSTWRDNPWISAELIAEKDHLARTDPEAYQFVWEGEPLKHSAAQILAGKYIIEPFEPMPWWQGPYHGLDLGFNDPTAAVRCYIEEIGDQRKLYVSHEAVKVNCDLDSIPALLERMIPGAKDQVIRCDGAWAQSVVHLRYHGLPKIESVEKWPNSVEEGVKYLRGRFDQIIIHPRCEQTILEAGLYSFKTDKLTGEIRDEIADRHNHCWDAVRYAIAPLIRYRGEMAMVSVGGPNIRYRGFRG